MSAGVTCRGQVEALSFCRGGSGDGGAGCHSAEDDLLAAGCCPRDGVGQASHGVDGGIAGRGDPEVRAVVVGYAVACELGVEVSAVLAPGAGVFPSVKE
jgi:hypothetical protein